MIVRHRITGKTHTISREQYESQTGAKALYDVIDDTDYVPEELKGEAVAVELENAKEGDVTLNADNAETVAKPVNAKAATGRNKPKAE